MNMINKSRHNNISQTMGNFYHYYVVIDKLFDLNEGEEIIIEVHGDITRAKKAGNIFIENYEIKYHESDNILNYANEDFWKTLKNWVNDFDKYQEDTVLTLYTTSSLGDDLKCSVDNETPEKKIAYLKYLSSKTKNKEIETHCKVIFNDSNKLKSTINKIKFLTGQPSYIEIESYIINKHKNYFDLFDDRAVKKNVIETLLGNIITSLKDKENWAIDYQYFKDKKRELVYKNAPNKKVIDESELCDDDHEYQANQDLINEKLYIRKLKQIKLSEPEILQASINKYRAIKFTDLLLKHKYGIYEEKLEHCEKSYTEEWCYKKPYHQRKIKNLSQLTASQEFYNEVYDAEISKNHLYEEDKTKSFGRGYWHILADDEDKKEQIYWLIEEL